MKRVSLFLLIALFSLTVTGQGFVNTEVIDENATPPRFLGDESFNNGRMEVETIHHYLSKILNYPVESSECLIQGTEVVEFVITSGGEIAAFNIINSVCPQMDQEVIRALKTTHGRWLPGTADGKLTDTKQEIAIVFTLCSCENYMRQVQKMAYKGYKNLFVHNNPARALRYYNIAINLRPNDERLLAERSLCRYATGDVSGAENDWQRIKTLQKRNNSFSFLDLIALQAKSSDGYEAMMQAINQ